MSLLGLVPGGHMYVDESTAKQYLVMCAVVQAGDVNPARKAMRGLLLPGQRSLHMKNEKKRALRILDAIVALEPTVLILGCPVGLSDVDARARCVRRLSVEACQARLARVILDPIESLEKRDLSWLHQGARGAGHHVPPFHYGHQKRYQEPLLWIADAVGWAWQRDGAHKARVERMVTFIEP